ncbi:hypothetical protein K435DRAFT_723032 [Dendrothele bispora CBS 962.96]|uniref:CHAT domain-containing protein n=1 Tax=Dendrothele bispora (strain CBS 962.96) TaxID=1314807 RepID=A0A4S8M2G0_DENBC|nr:hypothetical protein K435DRAFT_723032 [Dendrothele bispora CBS 962.96]
MESLPLDEDYAVHPTPSESDDESSGVETSEDDDLSSIDSEITLLRIKCQSSKPQNEDYQKLFATMTRLLLERFKLSQEVTYLCEAITWARNTVTPSNPARYHTDNDPMEHLSLLENCLHEQYVVSGDRADVDEAISTGLEVVKGTPDGHIERPKRLYNLADSFRYRHELTYSNPKGLVTDSDIDKSISALKQAVDLTPNENPFKPMYLSKLGDALLCRFAARNASDLDEAIQAQTQAVNLLPCEHADKASYLSDLSSSLRSRYTRMSNAVDLEKSITAQKHAVELTPEGDASKPVRLSNLAYLFSLRFQDMGYVGDVDRSISCRIQVIELASDDAYNKPTWLSDLGLSLVRHFNLTDNIVDLDNAITYQTQAINIILDQDRPADRPQHFNNLANTFFTRFRRLNNITDLNKAIDSATQALKLTPHKHVMKARHLSNLGSLLFHRSHSEHTGNDKAAEDIDKAISYQTEAVELISRLTGDRNPGKPGYLTNLGISLRQRFERSGSKGSDGIDKAIDFHTKAVELTPDGCPNKSVYLSNLAAALQTRYERLQNIIDIEHAISAHKRAIGLTPSGHTSKPDYLYRLGLSLQYRFARLNNVSDADEAISAFCESAGSHSGLPLTMFKAACSWARLCVKRDARPSLVAWKTAIDLIPRFVWLGTNVDERYNAVVSAGDAFHEAVASSIELQEYKVAVEWMEQGRCIVWGQILRLRTPLDDLAAAQPEIARGLKEVSLQLEAAGIGQPFISIPGDANSAEVSLEEDAQKHRRLADQYEALLKQARQIPGFEHFLQPKQLSNLLQGWVANSPVAMINLDENRCDALVLRDCTSPILHIALDRFDLLTARELQLTLLKTLAQQRVRIREAESNNRAIRVYSLEEESSMQHILGILWTSVVHPILSGLGQIASSTPETKLSLSHITWCVTGPLVFLPLHAAGLYNSSDDPKLFHTTMSSYTPSLTILVEAAKRASSSSRASSPRILALSQPNTPYHTCLQGTTREVKDIQEVYIKHTAGHNCHDFKWLNGEEATISAVLTKLSTHPWCHFACHGIQHPDNPTSSAFALHDGPLDLRTIMSKSFASAEVAFLSACQTATGDEKRPEEAVHLVAGMLVAGYQTVFGTMWSIGDSDAPLVAKEVYACLLNSGEDPLADEHEHMDQKHRAAYALHRAVERLREKVGVKEFVKWVPFVHYGV